MSFDKRNSLSNTEFQQIHAVLSQKKDEAWYRIPWASSLQDARRRSITDAKPIYMLVRSGHPLGCV